MSNWQQRGNEQQVLWNSAADGWIASQDLLDQLFQPLEDLLLDVAQSGSPHRVLDVGCGTGSTTVAVAKRLGENGTCTGVDISVQMIGAARARAARDSVRSDFLIADAQTYPFERASVDTFISRFGVMFFNDSVEAFSNLRRAATTGAALHFLVWRSAAENPFMTTAERAAAPLLPNLKARQPNEPGQFALADPDRSRSLLEKSGWTEIQVQPIDVPCAFPEGALVQYISQLGPVGRILQQVDDDLRTQVITRVRPAFDPYVHGADVRFTAACWLIGARA
jgi:ubiquinone/menaquinone biosynthesis C-methylase UbiE